MALEVEHVTAGEVAEVLPLEGGEPALGVEVLVEAVEPAGEVDGVRASQLAWLARINRACSSDVMAPSNQPYACLSYFVRVGCRFGSVLFVGWV